MFFCLQFFVFVFFLMGRDVRIPAMTKRRPGARTALVVGMAASLLVSVAALPAALSGPVAAGGRRALLTLRGGGGKAPEAPAVKLPPRGFIARRFDKFVTDTFESIDVDKSGTVDLHEFHVLVLELYLKLNREAPVEPPTREALEKFFKDADKGWLCTCVSCVLCFVFCVLCVCVCVCVVSCVVCVICVDARVRVCAPVRKHAHTLTHGHTLTHALADRFRQERQSLKGRVRLAGNEADRSKLSPRRRPQIHDDSRRSAVWRILRSLDNRRHQLRNRVRN